MDKSRIVNITIPSLPLAEISLFVTVAVMYEWQAVIQRHTRFFLS